MFRSQLFDHLQLVVLHASAVTTFSACLRRLFAVAVCCLQYNICTRMIPWLYLPRHEEKWSIWRKGYGLTYVCACVPDVLVCGMFGCELTTTHPTDKYIRHAHTHRQHYSHIQNKRRKQAEKVVIALSTKDDPLKMAKQLWPKHVGF